MNDTRSWVDSLTALRGRNRQFGEDIIMQAKAVTAIEAHKLKAIDFVGDGVPEFLKFADGRKVKLAGGENSASVHVGPLENFKLDIRYKTLSILTDPELAYMLLLASLALLYFEITHSGMILPGVAGGAGLVIAMVALHKLDVEWGGLLLIFLGVGLLVAEMFIPSFGLVGLTGMGALVLGSVFLFDPVQSFGYHLPYGLIAAVVIVFGAALFGVTWLFLKTFRRRKRGGFEDLIDVIGEVISVNDDQASGRMQVHGEIWNFTSASPLALNDRVVIKGNKGMTLQVEKEA
jgi:membrane-bound serine protease (ClpP class)